MNDFLSQHLDHLFQLEVSIGYSFNKRDLLRQALTHKSFVHENQSLGLNHNEALEFLGDSVLGFIISSSLYRHFPGETEGNLSRFRSYLVSGNHLVHLARELNLGSYLLLGRGENKTGGYQKKNILIDTLEALIAAIYLDGGFRPARSFVLRIFKAPIKNLKKEAVNLKDYKTQLQEYMAEKLNSSPRYVTIGEEGPDHEKTFFVQIEVNGVNLGRGYGQSKKSAQQMAARETLQILFKQDVRSEE